LFQIAYWLHIIPELYFQKVKREDMSARIQYSSLYLLFIGSAYLVNFVKRLQGEFLAVEI
jgi:translocating chain-associated membrane protein 1